MRVFLVSLVLLVPALEACGEDVGPDLPAGWEGAIRVEKLIQMTCSGSQSSEAAESLSHGEQPAEELAVVYEHAHFRCEQPVEAYMREESNALEV